MPTCPRCLNEKVSAEFGMRAGGKYRRSWCRGCENSAEKERRLTDAQLRRKVRAGRSQRSYWSQEQFDKAVAEQEGKCKICSCVLTELRREGTNTVHADHHPTRNTPRAILCRMCNAGLGMFKDDADLMRRAASYLDYYDKE